MLRDWLTMTETLQHVQLLLMTKVTTTALRGIAGFRQRYSMALNTSTIQLIVDNRNLIITSFHQEKELLRKKQEEIEEDERAKRSKVVMSFDLVGRKVVFTSLFSFPH